MVFRPQTLLTLLIVVVSAFVVQQSLRFPVGAGIYPLVIGVITLGLSLAQLGIELRGGGTGATGAVDLAVEEEATGTAAMRRGLRFLLWLAGLYVGTYLVGFNISLVLFFFLYIKVEGQSSWRTVILMTAIAAAMELYYFPEILGMRWATGLLQEFVDIPF
ncbi:MAG: hypothetical protein HY675_23335 [Chloroflexi bacterium]|nr:hypothetical protein [Chloroflexota bacterium]